MEGFRFFLVCFVIGSYLLGMELALELEVSMEIRTEVFRGLELRITRYTYSFELVGDIWCSRSRESWV